MRISDWSSDVCSSDLVRTGPVACWRTNCDRNLLCDDCRLLRPKDTVAESAQAPAPLVAATPQGREQGRDLRDRLQVFVGIGNPGEVYRDTPHNAGFSVMDILAERHRLKDRKSTRLNSSH